MSKKQDTICLDQEHNDFITENTRASWLEYCKLNGIDPNTGELLGDNTLSDAGGQ